MKLYEHTQIGYTLLITLAMAIIFVGVLIVFTGMNWIGTAVLIMIAIVLLLFSSLTVILSEDVLYIKLGPGLVHRRFNLKNIELIRVVKNPWYYGWGVHTTPHGLLYNVSGFSAVEIKLKNGNTYRIGTDAPQELYEALQRALEAQKKST